MAYPKGVRSDKYMRKWLDRLSVIEAILWRVVGLISILLIVGAALAHEWHGLMHSLLGP